MSGVRTGWVLVRETAVGFSDKNGSLLAAALAFHVLLSLAPLVIVAVALAGSLLGASTVREELRHVLQGVMGTTAASAANGWIDGASQSTGVASLVGALLTLIAASSLLSHLKSALNQIWNVGPSADSGIRATILSYFRERFLGFALVVAAGPLLLLVVATRALSFVFNDDLFGTSFLASLAAHFTQVLLSLALVTFTSAAAFRFVPDRRVPARSVWLGALVTSVLFNVGNLLVGLYLARAGVVAIYGAAGSVVVVLLWLDYSAQTLLFGAQFTDVHARRFASEHKPPGAAGSL